MLDEPTTGAADRGRHDEEPDFAPHVEARFSKIEHRIFGDPANPEDIGMVGRVRKL